MVTTPTDTSESPESYWVQVAVRLELPLETSDGDVVTEYAVNLGIVCKPGELKDAVVSAIDDGNVIWSETEWRLFKREAITDEAIRRRTDLAVEHGVWYRSGRILLSE